jgi:DNA-binding transcriptional LysR family regulator
VNTDAVMAFIAVAEEGQFQRAAGQLGISQQATSKRVAGLEAELGTVLFRRVPSGALLTRDGRTFLPHAYAVAAAARAAVESVQPRSRPLRVDVLARRGAAVDLVRDFLAASPGLTVDTVTGGGAAATITALLGGEVDAGYAYLRDAAAELGSPLSRAYAYLEPMQVIVGARHPFARAGRAGLADLARYPAWVPGIVAGSEWEAFYQELSATFGLTVDPTPYSSGTDSVFDSVAASDSLVTFVGEKSRVALPGAAALVRLPVTDPVPLYPWSLIWRSQTRHPGTRRLIEHAQRAFTPPPVGASVWLPRQARDDLAVEPVVWSAAG